MVRALHECFFVHVLLMLYLSPCPFQYPQQRESMGGSMRNIRLVQNEKGSPSLGSGGASKNNSPSSPGNADRKKEFKSPREILENDGRVEVVRKRNISSSLLDFFGMP